ncbi:MAG: ABC transporter substrate-binding protein, partial [Clostridia bacterium]|nr:ABC transporter substrate-binding protein [Clostridia bacterium]
MRKKALFGLISGIMVCVLLLSGCAKKEPEVKVDTVRLCEVTHSIFYAPQYVAIAKGFFEEENIDIELSNGGGADKV